MATGQGGDDRCLEGVCCEMRYLSPHKVLALVSTQSDERLRVASGWAESENEAACWRLSHLV